jgi:hypothetical protein
MNSYSVIVTVHNMAKVIGRTLHSVETAIEVFRQQESEAASGRWSAPQNLVQELW